MTRPSALPPELSMHVIDPTAPSAAILGSSFEDLRVPLNDEEHRTKGEQLAKLLGELAALKELHKEQRAEQKAQLAAVQLQIDEARDDVQLKSEVRSVEVEHRADFTKGVVETVRVDTGAVVATRAVTDDDRQQSLA